MLLNNFRTYFFSTFRWFYMLIWNLNNFKTNLNKNKCTDVFQNVCKCFEKIFAAHFFNDNLVTTKYIVLKQYLKHKYYF